MSDKVKFLFQNDILDATLTASSEAISKSNLQHYKLSKVWRTTDLTNEYISAALASTGGTNFIAIWGHNLTTAAEIRVRLGDDPTFVTNAFDDTYYAWDAVTGFDEGGFDEGGFDGVPVLSDENSYGRYTVIKLPDSYNYDYIRLDFTDPTNPDGYIQVGYWASGLLKETDYDVSVPSELPSWVDPSMQYETESSDLWVCKRPKYRVATYSFEFLSKSEALIMMDDLSRIIGGSLPIIVLYFSDDVTYQYRYAMFGLITNASQGLIKRQLRQNTEANSFGITLNVRELRQQL